MCKATVDLTVKLPLMLAIGPGEEILCTCGN